MDLDRNIRFDITDATNHRATFDNLKKLLSFLTLEIKFWTRVKEANASKKHRFFQIIGQFNNFQNSINGWVDIDNWDDRTLQQQLQNIVSSSSIITHGQQSWLWSQHSFTERFIEILLETDNATADSFFNYQLKSNLPAPASKQSFDGFLLGYEFEYQNSDLVKRRHTERIQITKLRDQLLEKNAEALELMSSNQNSYEEWFEATKLQLDNYNKSVTYSSERKQKAIKLVTERRHKRMKSNFDSQMSNWLHRIEGLETLYEEKLRLQKPAQYWKRASKKYASHGSIFAAMTLALVAVAAKMVLHLFELWLIGSDSMFSVKTVQGATLFAAMAALFAFAIRATTRLAFSSFHLMRDAEEREQLTYLYLSLINESAVEKDSRDIVLQALFSRSETGLLANENGPTMPSLNDSIRTLNKSN